MKVKVYMQTLTESHILYVNDKKRDYVLVDTKETNYDAGIFIFTICDIVKDWPNKLEDKNILDGLEYRIIIKNKDKEREYILKNKFPENIYRLEMLINEVLGEVKNV